MVKNIKEPVKKIVDTHNKTRSKVRQVVNENDTPFGKAFDIFIQITILISIAVFSIETIPDLSDEWMFWLNIIDVSCYILFTVEYLARIFIAKNPFKFIFSFYGIIDLIAILPFILGRQFDLRVLRSLRVFKILTMIKMTRYREPIERFSLVLKMIRPELTLFTIISSVFLFVCAVGIHYFEYKVQPDDFSSIFQCLWWAIVTMATVGYGDVVPITTGGKIFSGIAIFLGFGIVSIPSGLIASALTRAREITKEKGEKENAEDEDI